MAIGNDLLVSGKGNISGLLIFLSPDKYEYYIAYICNLNLHVNLNY